MSNPYYVGTAYSNALLDDIWRLCHAIYIQGNYLYATSDSEFMIVNIADPENPYEVFRAISSSVGYASEPYKSTNWELWGSTYLIYANRIKVQGNYAYYIRNEHPSWASMFVVINVSNKQIPQIISFIDYAINLTDVEVSGNYAYICSNDDDFFQIIDISNPGSLVALGSISGASMNGPDTMAVKDNYVFVATDQNKTITIVDCTNKSSPVVHSVINEPVSNYFYNITKLKIYGDFLYVAGYDFMYGIAIYNIYNIDDPVLLGYYRGKGEYATNIRDFIVDGNYFYGFDSGLVWDGGHYLTVLDITDKTNITLSGIKDVVTAPGGIAVSNGYIWIAKRLSSEGCFSYTTTELQASLVVPETEEEAIGKTMQDLHSFLTYGLNIASDVHARTEQVRFWSDKEILRAINEGYLDFVRRTHCLQKFAAIPLIADQTEYSLPTDLLKLLWVGDGTYNLVGQSLDYMDNLDDNWIGQAGTPRCYVQELGGIKKLNLYETPETSGISTFTADTNHTEADADTGMIAGLTQDDTAVEFTADSNHTEADEDTGIVILFTGEDILLTEETETGVYTSFDQMSGNLLILYAYEPVEFNNLQEAKTPDFMAVYHNAIVYFALSELYLKEGDVQNIPLSNFYKMLYDEMVEDKIETMHVSNLKIQAGNQEPYRNLPPGPHLPLDTYPLYRRI